MLETIDHKKQWVDFIHRSLRGSEPHNMDDDLPFALPVIQRGRTFQYLCRIPDDLKDVMPVSRNQRSRRTRDKARAYAAAAIHAEIEKQFAAARRAKGFTLDVVAVDDWGWTDWQPLADWFKAVLIEDDWRVRLRNIPGSAFSEGADSRLFWRDTEAVLTRVVWMDATIENIS